MSSDWEFEWRRLFDWEFMWLLDRNLLRSDLPWQVEYISANVSRFL